MRKTLKFSQKSVLLVTQQILEALRLHWKLFLGIHVTVNLVSLVVLTPLVTLLIGWLILVSGQTALTDEDILFFVLTPTGLAVMLLASALYTTILIFEQAAMITAGHLVSLGQDVSLPKLGRSLVLKTWPLLQLALRMIGRTILVATPFLLASTLIYFLFLTQFDINYYLANKPPVFWWAGGSILFCLLLMAAILLRIFSGWTLALPLLLIGGESPARVLKLSQNASVSMRIPITMILLMLFLLNAGILGLVSFLTEFAVDGLVMLAGDSLEAMAYFLGGLLLVWLGANVAITFFGNSVLSLVIFHLFVRLTGATHSTQPGRILAPVHAVRTWYLSGAKLVGFIIVFGVFAGLALNSMMGRLHLEDHAMIVAHRGASADAPENTLAAMELAIREGADWIEIDVQETREGEIVVIHDSDLKKIAGSGLKVYESSLADLQSVDIGSWKDPSFSDQRIPTLQQVLALCKDRINIVIELKYYGREKRLEERVASLVDAAGMQDQIMVMSLSYPGILKMKSIRTDWSVGLLSSVAIGDITRLQVDFFAINARFASRTRIKQIHKRGRRVFVWTVNDPVSMSSMMSKGVDGIITDKPGLASNIRDERAELDMHERLMIQLASLVGKQPVIPEQ